jgi:uncharacterized repeat protein (TIGR01451 family)
LDYSSDNTIYNNYFNNTNNAYDDGNNIWNTTKTAGTNIIGGSWLGGNYWSDYAGTDTDGDGLGDTLLPYNSSGEIIAGGDYQPLVAVGFGPILSIDKSDDPDPVSPGGTLNYTISVNNTGYANATNVRVIETYDTNVTFVSAVPAPATGNDTWIFPTLNVSETKWINISAIVNLSTSNGAVLHNIVSVTCDEGITDSDTEDTAVPSKLKLPERTPGISVNKTASPTEGTPSTPVAFTINVTNTGGCPLDPVAVADTLPAGMSYVFDDSGGTVVDTKINWTTSLGVDESRIIHLVARIDEEAVGVLNNTVNVTGNSSTGDVYDWDTA